ncbi:WD repeat and HMG-box DNA-binding protein 1 [Anthonomus grandis grandis]|uniref:WD repeat and HMG-box DNA-binding protein 1 n=1 Tax=Anthonomus grandis grandis TaxID=2921223 RepID=UPI002165B326|nr:WD repeat and HMG-box DNA-binding protein 1 [Anthonomus grandis grandis]
MKIEHEPLRYAHDEGHTDVCYSADGNHFITCGADGDIRIWSVDEGEDPNHTCIGEWALSVKQKNDKIYVATGSNEIQILTHPEGERDGVLTRATDPFNQIVLCKNKNIAALAGEGMEILVMDLDTCCIKNSFKDLGAPCLSVALCPHGKKLAASLGDGNLKVWDVDSGDLLKEITCFPKVNSFANAKNLCRLDFEPNNGTFLAYPLNNTIKLLNTVTWNDETLSCENISADFSIVQYSSCGKYLAAATVEGDFVIWETCSNKVLKVSKHESSKAVCGLMWNPKGNGQIVYTDIEGQLSIMSNCSSISNKAKEDKTSETVDDLGFTENEVDFGEFMDETENENADRDNEINTEEIFKDFDDVQSSPHPKLSTNASEAASSRSSTPRPRTPEVPLQPPFMPTSTPDHLDPRYLCWNEVGIVKSYGTNSEDELSSKTIEVEFHDSTFHNSMMLQNFQEYTMGSIGKGALVVANSSQIMVIPLAVSNKEWTLKAEEYEDILLVAASENIICFATSNYLVRVCSIFGTQIGIVSIPGPFVSIAAFKNVLLVAYHSGPVRNGDQCINIKLYKFDGFSMESHDLGSALGPESTLYWLGFSDQGTPAMMDSLGMLSLFPPKCNSWIPFCDTTKHRKGAGDMFFITAIFESYQAIAGIKCKGTVYPGFIPRPTVCEVPIEPPFAENATEKTQMEGSLFTWSSLNVSDTERKYKESALKLFALACKNDLDQRAFEFMQLINHQQILSLGLKYASKLKKRRLAEKLTELAERLQEEDQDEAPTKTFHSTPVVPEIKDEEVVVKPKAGISRLTPRNKKPKKDSQMIDETQINGTGENNITNTQESLFSESNIEEPPRNPFVKKPEAENTLSGTPSSVNPFLKKSKSNQPSPLSLTDKYAGVHYEPPEKNKQKGNEVGEKRKLSDSDSEKPTGKQRKLETFFSKMP